MCVLKEVYKNSVDYARDRTAAMILSGNGTYFKDAIMLNALVFQDADGNTVLEGTDVKNAEAQTQENSTTKNKEYVVALQLTKEGTTKFAEATAANVGKQISIIYDGQTISSPRVNQAIEGGEAVITGMSSYEEADNLAATIRIGGLSLELEELRSNVVAAQLGEEAITD